MLYCFLVCGLSTTPVLRNSLVPNTYKIIWGVVFGDIYWIIPRSHPFPKFFVVEFASIIFPYTRIRRVAINNVTFFMLIVVVVRRGEVNLLFCGKFKALNTVNSFKVLNHIKWETNNPFGKSRLCQFPSAFVNLVKAFLM